MKPRWLALLGAVLVVMVAFGMLGAWQLDVAWDRGREAALREVPLVAPVPVEQLLKPHTAFDPMLTGRRVRMTGSYDVSGQVLVTGRRLGQRDGSWVVTPLVVEATQARMAVVRGLVDAKAKTAPEPPRGTVVVTGGLAAGESPATAPADGPVGTMASLDLSVLVNRWPGDLYNAFVFLVDQQPRGPADAGLLPVPPPPPQVGGIEWRSAAYALQWWLFGLFAGYMWWRMVRDDAATTAGMPSPSLPENVVPENASPEKARSHA